MNSFDYFNKITKIPRESGNEKQISEFILDFAKEHNLKAYRDEYYNVKVFKNNNSDKSIILQAHLDMVCEKLIDKDFDFNINPIQTIIKDDFIMADGTTLGADDGFGIALILSILADENYDFPNIEAIFTTQEETSMIGCKNIDCGDLKSNMMIGLDETNSSQIVVGCAGSCRLTFNKDVKFENENKTGYKLTVRGLIGGHSGEDINSNRANANKLVFNFLSQLTNVQLSNYVCDSKVNAIPRECDVLFYSTDDVINKFVLFKNLTQNQFPNETNLKLEIEQIEITTVLNLETSKQIIDFGNNFKNGVLATTVDYVLTSINLANIILSKEKGFCVKAMLRSSSKEQLNSEANAYTEFAKKYGFKTAIDSVSPFFERQVDGFLENLCRLSYKKLFCTEPKIVCVHAGLEGGVLCEKIPNLQVVELGADLYDIHTPSEKMSISSLEKVEKWLIDILIKYNRF